MGNLEAAIKELDHLPENGAEIIACVIAAFRAYDDGDWEAFNDKSPTPEPPEFKPDQWVMAALPGKKWKLYQLKRRHEGWVGFWVARDRDWERKEDDCIIPEKFIRHATDAEMYRPGAIATWQAVIYPDLSVTGKVSRIQMDTIVFEGMKLNYSMSKCTLITAAPEGEADDE